MLRASVTLSDPLEIRSLTRGDEFFFKGGRNEFSEIKNRNSFESFLGRSIVFALADQIGHLKSLSSFKAEEPILVPRVLATASALTQLASEACA